MNEEPTFFTRWFRINAAFKAGRLPWLRHPGGVLQARRNPLHDHDCQCRSCQFARSEAKLAVKDFLDETRRTVEREAFIREADWIKGILVDE